VSKAIGTPTEDVRGRYAETMRQLTAWCTLEQAGILISFAPLLVDIIHTEVAAKTISAASGAVCSLLSPNEGTVVATLLRHGLVEALVTRLQDPKVSIVQQALNVLSVLACGSNSTQMLELEPALVHLQQFVNNVAVGKDNDRVGRSALECVRLICEGGGGSVRQICESAPVLFKDLFLIVRRALEHKQVNPCSDVKAVTASRALMIAANAAEPDEYAEFVKQDIHELSFTVLTAFEGNADVVHDALTMLQSMVLKHATQGDAALSNAELDWSAVRRLAKLCSTDGGGERKGYTEQQLHNSEVARTLYSAAHDAGLV
jgi:hypothetical protein